MLELTCDCGGRMFSTSESAFVLQVDAHMKSAHPDRVPLTEDWILEMAELY